MNLTEIGWKYPKAFQIFLQWLENPSINKASFMAQSMFNSSDDRLLFDFFDEQGITVLITREFAYGYEILLNGCDVEESNIEDLEVNKWYDSRTEAEKAAFLKAFEILEGKL